MTKKLNKHKINLTPACLFKAGLFVMLMACVQDLYAQFRVYPIERKEIPPATTLTSPSKQANARTKEVTPLSLPFWDDFSFTPVDDPDNPLSNYPLETLWTTSSQSTWVNNGGINMPSHHVATFDGLNRLGASYSDVTLANGFCDTLESQFIDLSAVPEIERNTVWLSFFYQWKGNGEPPDKNDFIRLQFLNEDSIWVTQLEIYPKESFDPTVFYDTIIQVKKPVTAEDENYFHNEFQFRFLNRGRKTGPFDTWNLDYIYLNKGRTINSTWYADRSIASGLNPIFGPYYSIPKIHYTEEILDSVKYDVQSQSNHLFDNVLYKTSMRATNYTGGVATVNEVFEENSVFVAGHERKTITPPRLPMDSQLNPIDANADSVSILYTANISGDENDIDAPAFAPINFKLNDTIRQVYDLKNYYAYDDGTAEYSGGTSSGKFLYAFDLFSENTERITALFIYFVPSSLNVTKQITLYIHGDNNGVPESLPLYVLPYTVKRTGLNEFQRIDIKELVTVKDRFYVGYESQYVKVGLDFSHETGDRVFYSAGGNVWVPNDENIGSMMIRPFFGPPVPIVGVPEENTDDVALYPNPNNGTFIITNTAKVEQAIDVTGRSVPFTSEMIDETTNRINIQQNTPGVYILKMRKGQTLFTRKVVIRH